MPLADLPARSVAQGGAGSPVARRERRQHPGSEGRGDADPRNDQQQDATQFWPQVAGQRDRGEGEERVEQRRGCHGAEHAAEQRGHGGLGERQRRDATGVGT